MYLVSACNDAWNLFIIYSAMKNKKKEKANVHTGVLCLISKFISTIALHK